MKVWLMGGGLGLLLGWTLQRTGLTEHAAGLLRLKRPMQGRTTVVALGWAMLLVAGLGWLAVLDVDHLQILQLTGGTLAGAVLLGVGLGISGYTPGTALAAVGGGALLPAVCTVAGGLVGAWCWQALGEKLQAVNGLFAPVEGTLFRTTLTAPYLLPGGFWLHGAAGLVVLGVGLCIGRGRRSPAVETVPVQEVRPPVPETPPTPEEVAAETVVAALPQEEPLTVDTSEPTLAETEKQAAAEEAAETAQEEPVPAAETALSPAERLLAGKTPVGSEALPAAEPTPLIHPVEDAEKKRPDD